MLLESLNIPLSFTFAVSITNVYSDNATQGATLAKYVVIHEQKTRERVEFSRGREKERSSISLPLYHISKGKEKASSCFFSTPRFFTLAHRLLKGSQNQVNGQNRVKNLF